MQATAVPLLTEIVAVRIVETLSVSLVGTGLTEVRFYQLCAEAPLAAFQLCRLVRS